MMVPPGLARQIHDRINEERVKRGLPTMRWDEALSRIASKHSSDMAQNRYFGHISPRGHDLFHRYVENRYACGVTVNGVLRRGAENIYRLVPARDEDLVEAILRGWMQDSANRKNILSPYWGRQGIGISNGQNGALYITLDLC